MENKEQNNVADEKLQIDKLEKQLRKAHILIKMQKKILNNFVLHDDAGTAYVYLGPHPEDLNNISEVKADLEKISSIQKYDYILESLYDIQTLIENSEVSEEVLSAIELVQDKYLDLYIEQREKRGED